VKGIEGLAHPTTLPLAFSINKSQEKGTTPPPNIIKQNKNKSQRQQVKAKANVKPFLSITESGRLFVWGENHYGQLGIGGHGGGASGKKGGGHNGDIVTKPTCVKALKTLGLKICDAAFGNHWAVMLTRE